MNQLITFGLALGLAPDLPLSCDQAGTLYRYHHAIRGHVGVKAFQGSKPAWHIAVRKGSCYAASTTLPKSGQAAAFAPGGLYHPAVVYLLHAAEHDRRIRQ